MNRSITIIMYHFIRDSYINDFYYFRGLTTNQFNQQIKFLKNRYSIISLFECIHLIRSSKDFPDNACILTFDDGYIDHYNNVFPILKDHGVLGAFFPPGSSVLENKLLDVNKIQLILSYKKDSLHHLCDVISSQLQKLRVEHRLKSYNYYFQKYATTDRFDLKEAIFVKRLLQVGLNELCRSKIINYLFNKFVDIDENDFSEKLYMNSNQLKTLIDNGMFVGSHSYNHNWLGEISNSRQRSDIEKSLIFIKDLGVSTQNWIMCYPYGSYNISLVNILKQKGCFMAFKSPSRLRSRKFLPTTISSKSMYSIDRIDASDLQSSPLFKQFLSKQ